MRAAGSRPALVGVLTIAVLLATVLCDGATGGAVASPKTLAKLCGLPYVRGTVVRFRAGDGAQLVGAVAGTGHVGVLFASDGEAGICDWVSHQHNTINAIVAAGDQVLLFDYRGTGFSPKHAGSSSGAWDHDAIGAAAELRRLGARHVFLGGDGTGGIVVLAAASKVKPAPAGIIGLSAAGDPGGVTTGPTKGELDGKAAVAALRLPLLFIVAKADPYAYAPTRTLFRAAGSTVKQLLVVPGSGHGFFDDDPAGAKVRARILGFIKTHAKG
jgi:pimeloyl-ACP methyl ester carboxylesterase